MTHSSSSTKDSGEERRAAMDLRHPLLSGRTRSCDPNRRLSDGEDALLGPPTTDQELLKSQCWPRCQADPGRSPGSRSAAHSTCIPTNGHYHRDPIFLIWRGLAPAGSFLVTSPTAARGTSTQLGGQAHDRHTSRGHGDWIAGSRAPVIRSMRLLSQLLLWTAPLPPPQ